VADRILFGTARGSASHSNWIYQNRVSPDGLNHRDRDIQNVTDSGGHQWKLIPVETNEIQ